MSYLQNLRNHIIRQNKRLNTANQHLFEVVVFENHIMAVSARDYFLAAQPMKGFFKILKKNNVTFKISWKKKTLVVQSDTPTVLYHVSNRTNSKENMPRRLRKCWNKSSGQTNSSTLILIKVLEQVVWKYFFLKNGQDTGSCKSGNLNSGLRSLIFQVN